MFNIRSKLMTAAAVAAVAVSSAAIATAATSHSTTSTTTTSGSQSQAPMQRPPGPHTVNGQAEKPLSGTTESKVRAAALDKVSGTVERVETNVDGSAPYEAHIRKSDGTEVEIQVSSDFKVAAVNEMGAMGGMGGQHP